MWLEDLATGANAIPAINGKQMKSGTREWLYDGDYFSVDKRQFRLDNSGECEDILFRVSESAPQDAVTTAEAQVVVLKKSGHDGPTMQLVAGEEYTIGKSDDADIRVKLETVAAVQAKLGRDEHGKASLIQVAGKV